MKKPRRVNALWRHPNCPPDGRATSHICELLSEIIELFSQDMGKNFTVNNYKDI